MKYLILKDILFNKKNVFLGVLASIFFSSIIIDGNQYSNISFFMVPSLLFSFLIGKMCYVEDNIDAYNFLKSLPLKKSYIVISKYIESYFSILLGYCIIFIMNFILKFFIQYQYNLFTPTILSIFSIVLLYNSIYLFLNYRYNYAAAQQTVQCLLIFYVGLFAAQKYINFNTNIVKFLNAPQFNLIILFITVIISIFLCKKCTTFFIKKEN